MGYALLYESMLDSVLHARDRFLKPVVPRAIVERGREEGGARGGVMVPSQARMFLGLCSASEIYKDRVGYWSDVYGKVFRCSYSFSHVDNFSGYDMAPMAEDVYDEAIIDITGPETMLTDSVIIKVPSTLFYPNHYL